MNKMKLLMLLSMLAVSSISGHVQSAEKIKTIQLQVDGMVSNACPVILKSVVNKIDGVQYVEANLADHSAIVRYDSEKTTERAIQQKIYDQAGFLTEIQQP